MSMLYPYITCAKDRGLFILITHKSTRPHDNLQLLRLESVKGIYRKNKKKIKNSKKMKTQTKKKNWKKMEQIWKNIWKKIKIARSENPIACRLLALPSWIAKPGVHLPFQCSGFVCKELSQPFLDSLLVFLYPVSVSAHPLQKLLPDRACQSSITLFFMELDKLQGICVLHHYLKMAAAN